jgi:AcrR family transcriptional regulator
MYPEFMETAGSAMVRLTRKESQEETRRRLVASAITLFARSGVAATSLNAVAEHAGFTRGAVHGNYSGKDELATAVAETVAGELAPQLTQTLTTPAPSLDRLAAYIRVFLAYCAQHPDGTGALIAVVEYLGRADPGYYSDRAAASLGGLIELFEDGRRSGEMRTFDAKTMAFALRTVLDSTAALMRATETDVETLTMEIVALFVSATRAAGSP